MKSHPGIAAAMVSEALGDDEMPDRQNMIPDNEQWKLEGKCYLCRRKKYCHVSCKANRLAVAAIIRAVMRKKMSGLSTEDIMKQFSTKGSFINESEPNV